MTLTEDEIKEIISSLCWKNSEKYSGNHFGINHRTLIKKLEESKQ